MLLSSNSSASMVLWSVALTTETKRKESKIKNLGFIWNTSDNFGEEDAKIFTTMFPDFYVNEAKFCFDVYCTDQITDDNLEERIIRLTI